MEQNNQKIIDSIVEVRIFEYFTFSFRVEWGNKALRQTICKNSKIRETVKLTSESHSNKQCADVPHC